MLPARALSAYGDDIALVVLTLRVFAEGRTPWSISGLLLCAAFPAVLLARPAGRLVDAAPFRALAVVTAVWQAGCCVGLALATPLWSTYLLVLLLQAGQVVALPTWSALTPEIAEPDEVGRVVSASQAMNTVLGVAAPATAGLATAWLGYGAPLLLDAATFVVLGAAGALIQASRGRGAGFDVAGGVGPTPVSFSLRSDALLWPLILGMCALVLVGEVTNVVEVFLVRGALGASPAVFGLVGALLAAGIVAGSIVAGRAASDAGRAVRAVTSAIVLGLLLVVAGVAPTLWVFGVAWAILGVGNGIVNADVSTLVLTRTPDHARGRAIASVNGMVRGSSLGAMALGGAAGAVLGARPTFVVAGALAAAVSTALLVRIWHELPGVASRRPEQSAVASAPGNPHSPAAALPATPPRPAP
jgi:MFS family permease